MEKQHQTLLITGATGFIGSYFVDRAKDTFNIYAISRRRPKNNEFFTNPNIQWLQADIADAKSLEQALLKIDPQYPVEYVIHLAGFYDFNYDNNPEYERTNVSGTKNVLEQCKALNIKRFIFASSVAACNFPRKDGRRITETTPADAPFAYAETKKKGEQMTREYAQFYKTTVVRFAAAFSDWCEYGPLYVFLTTWLTRNWKARILGGKGNSAIPYLHVNCLVNLLLEVVDKSDALPDFDTYIASSSTSASHQELYNLSTHFFFGESRNPFHMPKWIATLGVLSMDLLGRVTGKRPFERPWMMQYVDKQMLVDNSYTREVLNWQPTRRYVIQRRLLFLIEHMKSYPYEWQKRNHLALKQSRVSPNFLIYEALDRLGAGIIEKCVEHLLNPDNFESFTTYHSTNRSILKKDTATLYQFLSVAVRAKDRMGIIQYAREIARIRAEQNFKPQEVIDAISSIGKIINEELIKEESLKGMQQEIYDEINLTFQLVRDEIEGVFESILRTKTSRAHFVLKRKSTT
ncbi:MAG: NAD(P)-dependent oxidoreductase [Calditrichaeota bacterium]|nr:NAD(P)-dependent oxidoreductase [Calditrichota bacterium]